GRKDRFKRNAVALQPPQGLAEYRHVARDLATPTSGQHEDHRRRLLPAPLLLNTWPEHPDLLGQRMTDVTAWRTAEPPVFLRFKRQQGQHVIDVGAHRSRPARTPRPNRWRYVIDDRDGRVAGANASCHPVGKIGAVDDDEDIR